MPEATARNKRSSTISKIGRMFGVYGEKEKDKASSSCSTGGSGLSNPASPVMNGNGFEKEEDKVAGVLSVGSSRFASANGSCSSLNKTENMRSLNKTENMRSLKDNSLKDGSFMKKLNSLKVNDDCGSSPAIAEESKDNFSSLTSTMSNPNMSHNTIGVKTRANRSQSVSKNNIRSKDSLKEWINSSGTELNTKHVSKLKNTSNASLQSRDNREPSGSRQPKQTSSKPTSKPTSKPSSKTTSNSSVNNGSATQTKDKYCGRLKMLEDGTHEHFLKSAKRQEKLSTMIKNFLGAKKLRDESVSAVSNILPNIIPDGNVPPSLMSGLMNKVHQNENGKIEVVLENNVKNAGTGNGNMRFPQGTEIQENLIDPRSFAEKYGTCQEVIGRGTFGVVKISHKKVSEHKENLYAVKEFRRRAPESEKEYSQRLAREFCISSSLKNIHIIQTLDLLQDAKGDYCEVMEFCTGGDLYTLVVTAGKLEYIEADCFFKQLVRGVSYMHNMGVAHRDIKPENILLTADGNLKITDFGTSECFSFAWESKIHLFQGVIGSAPYIAPELYLCKEYDLRPADVWACGVVYMAMRTGRQLWRSANADDDEFYQEYLKGRKDANGYLPIESLKRARCRNVIYSILDPVPGRRITAKQILNSEWGREIRCCEAGDYGTKTDNVAVN